MRITCPFCGDRDVQEFTCLGAADPRRPDGLGTSQADMVAYVYERENPAGPHRELWYHGVGCRAWLVVLRDTRTHEIEAVTAAAAAHGPASHRLASDTPGLDTGAAA